MVDLEGNSASSRTSPALRTFERSGGKGYPGDRTVIVTPGPVIRAADLGTPSPSAPESFLPQGRQRFYRNGRSALAAALSLKGIGEGARVLVPAYICQSVVTAIRSVGSEVDFYPISSSLEPDLGAIERLLSSSTSSLLAVHYFGFPMHGFDPTRKLCREKDVVLIEDCAHALFSRTNDRLLGSDGDAAIFSFRKSLPVPEGGALVLRDGPTESGARLPVREIPALLREVAFAAEDLIGASLRFRMVARPGVLERLYDADDRAQPHRDEPIGRLSKRMFFRQRPAEIAAARRRNFDHVGAALQDAGFSLLIGAVAPPGSCPVGLPVLVPERDRVRASLYRRGVGTRTFWDRLPKELPLDRFPGSTYLRDRILVLPVHHTLDEKRIRMMIDVLVDVRDALVGDHP
ncbi:MAG: DegT/DnrJ/EryC1/StrS family aminotransferase [Actinomycetota bacterium]